MIDFTLPVTLEQDACSSCPFLKFKGEQDRYICDITFQTVREGHEPDLEWPRPIWCPLEKKADL
jgi:hypothetical protein